MSKGSSFKPGQIRNLGGSAYPPIRKDREGLHPRPHLFDYGCCQSDRNSSPIDAAIAAAA